MSHPTQQPRGTDGDGKAPPPLVFDLQGGCPGHYSALHNRVAALCLTCARQPVGGEQIAPAWRREGGDVWCPNWVPHAVSVRPTEPGGHPTVIGGASHKPLQAGGPA